MISLWQVNDDSMISLWQVNNASMMTQWLVNNKPMITVQGRVYNESMQEKSVTLWWADDNFTI
jgi:hypothetical protein